MPYAGIDASIEISVNGGSNWYELDGIDTWSWQESPTKLNSTDFAQSGRSENSFQGLYTGQCTLSGALEAGDTNGQVALRTSCRNGTEIDIRVKYNGTLGESAKCRCYSFNPSVSVDGRAEVSFQCDFTTVPTSITE
jgi:hypothetical protein